MNNDGSIEAGYDANWEGVDPETTERRARDEGWSQAQL
jgi:hypothetical protein